MQKFVVPNKPFNYAAGPPAGSAKSPSSFPPPQTSAPVWAQPKQQQYAAPQQSYQPQPQQQQQQQYQPQPQQQQYQNYAQQPQQQQTFAPAPVANNYNQQSFGSNTLPRAAAQNAPGK